MILARATWLTVRVRVVNQFMWDLMKFRRALLGIRMVLGSGTFQRPSFPVERAISTTSRSPD